MALFILCSDSTDARRKNPTMQILLIEDDIDLGQAVAEHLEDAGHRVHWVKRLAHASDWLAVHVPDLLLLDLGLPDGDGLAALTRWRQAGMHLPALVLTARVQVADRIAGLRSGADDYLVKPFDLDELLARIDAVMRRTTASAPAADGLRLDAARRCALRGSETIELTAMEWAVLERMARHPGHVFSRADLEDGLIDAGLSDSHSNSLEVIISRLRKKLGAQAIHTQRGLGYRYAPDDGAPT